jgi:hypothetical protein
LSERTSEVGGSLLSEALALKTARLRELRLAKIGPVAAFKLVITVARLPKTRSGKVLRGTMKKIADGEPWTMPATIDDPVILNEIERALKGKGVGA